MRPGSVKLAGTFFGLLPGIRNRSCEQASTTRAGTGKIQKALNSEPEEVLAILNPKEQSKYEEIEGC